MERRALIENIIFSAIPSDLRKKANPVLFNECRTKQRQNAIKNIAPECPPENAVAFVDMTAWNTGNQGILFATDGIYAILENLTHTFPGSLKYESINSIIMPHKASDRLLLYYYKDPSRNIDLFYVLKMPRKYLDFFFAALNKIAESVMEDHAMTGSVRDEYNCALMFDEGRYSPANKEKAFFWYNRAALKGQKECQFQCARRYQLGEGVVGDKEEAEKWYKTAAENGHREAQFCYGKLCAGRGTAEGKKEAYYWYQQAAEGGHDEAARSLDAIQSELDRIEFEELKGMAECGDADAQFNCAEMYRLGKGTKVDFEEAFYWYGKAALQNHLIAIIQYAYMYSAGEGTAVDEEKCLYWCEKAAEQSDSPDMCYTCGSMYDKKSEEDSDKEKAMYWYEKAAGQGNVDAQFQCGLHYSKGKGVPEDKEKAFYWYKKAAEQGDSSSQFNTGLYYSKGIGTENDEEQALYWYEKAARQGNVKAQYNCGHRYRKGIGSQKDEEKAVYWLTEAASKGSARAVEECREWIGTVYPDAVINYDRGNYQTALCRLKISAGLGDIPSQCMLASMYYKGQGTVKDVDQAIYWYEKAAAQNDPGAQSRLGDIYSEQNLQSDALKWYKKAADLDDKHAQFQCGVIYGEMCNELDDYYDKMGALETALEYFLPLAEGADPDCEAQYNCGVIYDAMNKKATARMWYKKAAANGSDLAANMLKLLD